MAAEERGETLHSSLNKATNPSNICEQWDSIQSFYELVNKDTDGPQSATRLLAHKIQSPQENEALQALTVLEACMNNCGKRFHSEAGKFRFLNELIKVLSPKYLGAWTTEKVKLRVTEVLYGWTQWLKDEVKIQETYQMLRKQGIVKEDPKLNGKIVMPPPPPRLGSSVFDDEDRSKTLVKLLKSQRPDDLQAANLLIKSAVKEDQERADKVSKRVSAVELVSSSTCRLQELLEGQGREPLSAQEGEELKTLYERCAKMRPTLFRLASDTMDDDEALAEILHANDKLTQAINLYQEEVKRNEINGSTPVPLSPKEMKTYHLIDLSAMDKVQQSSSSSLSSSDAPLSLLEQQLISLGLNGPKPTPSTPFHTSGLHQGEQWRTDGPLPLEESITSAWSASALLRSQGCEGKTSDCYHFQQPNPSDKQPVLCSPALNSPSLDTSLTDVCVPLNSITPCVIAPITVYDKDGIRVMLHLAKDPPPGRSDLVVMVITILNTSPVNVKDVVFQAAVPKTMSIKLQPASGSQLPAYNPILPPVVISQVLLLSNPHKAKVRMRYKLALTHGEQKTCDLGEVDGFPDVTV